MKPGSDPGAEPVTVNVASPTGARFWIPVGVAVSAWLTYVLTLEMRNPRLVASWHGFLHTAIANRFPTSAWIPENPFFAGEPLRYYWVFHRGASALSRGLGVDPLSALRMLTLVGLVLLVGFAFLIGRRVCRSTGAGFLIGFLALAGLNPLGPAIAIARHETQGLILLEKEAGAPSVETVFTGNEAADQFMGRNLLGAMYFSTDWRHGENIVWFFDISSRGLSLAALLALVLLVLPPERGAFRLVLIGVTTALLAALNPIVGLASAMMLGFSLLFIDAMDLRRATGKFGLPSRSLIMTVGALALGVILAVPTFYHLFASGGGGTSINPPGVIAMKLVNMGVNFIVLLPLALLSTRVQLPGLTTILRAFVVTAGLLLIIMLTVHLEEGNEHNLTNTAQVLLALPAVVALAFQRNGRPRRNRAAIFAVTTAAFLPVTAATWVAFDGRPALPFQAAHGVLERTPSNAPLAELYRWIMRETGRDAVFVVDPSEPVKMSGNVSELPAFTGRSLLTDQPSYLTTPYPDSPRRTAIALAMVHGEKLTAPDSAYLWRLARPASHNAREIDVITYHADHGDLMDTLELRYGPARFHQGFTAVFSYDSGGNRIHSDSTGANGARGQ
ncbi:MAG: hypothetical protein ABI679_00285 [Gemmatimonadota bacterium]